MKKTELKDLVKETINEVREEQVTNKILRESLDHDVKMLQEYREAHSGFITEGVLTESQVDEGFFDTVKNLGKNVAGSVAAAGKSAVNAVGAAWKKAKAQGDEDEAKRLEKKLQALRGGNAGKKPLEPGDHGYTAAYAKSIGKKVASKQGNAANPQGGQPAAPAADKKKAAVQATKEIIKKMAKDDPKGLEQLKQYAKDPKKLEQLTKNPKIQQAGQKAKAEIAKEDKPGLFAKVAMWATENPVKASIGIGAITALAGALALPAAGPAALLMAGLQAAGINLATVSTLKQLARSSGVKGIKEESDVNGLDEELDGKIEEIDSRNRSK